MILVAVWVYQTALREQVEKLLFWVVLCSVTYLAVQFMMVNFNVWLIESFKEVGGYDGLERDLTSIGDRKTQTADSSFVRFLKSLVLELLPPFLGVVVVGVIKAKFMLKQALTPANIFGGMKEMFIGIKNSFKVSD
ncbi:MAG: hypothetical protein RQ715_03080 [Methylococcales bacterium]|nr:hypothetical protein [Methylococcales bacterium]